MLTEEKWEVLYKSQNKQINKQTWDQYKQLQKTEAQSTISQYNEYLSSNCYWDKNKADTLSSR